MKKIIKMIGTGLLLAGIFAGSRSQAETGELDYNVCTEGLQEDGSYVLKVSAQQIKDEKTCRPIQDALYAAQENASAKKPYIVLVEPGDYTLDLCLHAYSYTTLYVEGATFTQSSSYKGNMFKIGDNGLNEETGVQGDNRSGYYYKNITLRGGTWDGNGQKTVPLRAAHGKNFTVKNVTVQNNKDSHQLEIAGLNGFYVDGCTFKDQIITGTTANEAIQIDIMVGDHFNGYKSEVLTCKDIQVTNCTFDNVRRGVGSHTSWTGLPVEKVYIAGNTFSHIKSYAIECLNYTDCIVENNTINQSGRGIAVYSMRANGDGAYSTGKKVSSKVLNAKTVVRNNTISAYATDVYTAAGIDIQGCILKKTLTVEKKKIEKGNYKIKNVQVYGNTITSVAHGMIIRDASAVKAYKNTVSCSKSGEYYGIEVSERSTGISIYSNTISKGPKAGIIVCRNSVAKKIADNTISNSRQQGIWVAESTAYSITGNEISGAKSCGIRVGKKAVVRRIQKNTITGCKEYGIFVYGKSRVSAMQQNTIRDAGIRKILKKK
ncbi:MAG: right-handed parallel beta-helix repeat-containing protein [Clostridiaceae bacterium]|nr:right-handed parallel beta-helix repeat-containing protein [Clostridiaceae bacterium]